VSLHKAIAQASRNGLMARIIASFEPLLEATIPVAWSKVQGDAHHAMMLERHRELAETIRMRDPDAARKAMDEHFDRAVGASLPTS
jgi:GntR family transcriptional repressor for pyruvate dehydrogenase complex